jgi:hypothetical protein
VVEEELNGSAQAVFGCGCAHSLKMRRAFS